MIFFKAKLFIPKMTQESASRRVQSAENRFSRRGLYYSILALFARIDFRQLSIPSRIRFLSHFRYTFLFLITSVIASESPSIVYLTWIHDPTTTMTIHWHTAEEVTQEVSYRKVGDEIWQQSSGVYVRIPKTQVVVHTLELVDLEPGVDYEFHFSESNEMNRFRTMPESLDASVRFVVGGDAYYYLDTFKKMNREIAQLNPDFIVVGGDIAYTHGHRVFFKGKGWQLRRWQTFLRTWKEQMVTVDGRLIPILPVVGNHDVRASSMNLFSDHLLFYELFAFADRSFSYHVLDFSSYLSLFILDTGHIYHIEGEQTAWLKENLSQRENVPYKIAAYHVGAYPSVYPYRGGVPKQIRKEWCPLFEKYHLNVAFEHHNHAYKRTYPMKEEKIDPSGVIYMGDGSWGVPTRYPKNKKRAYLAKAKKLNAVCLVTLERDGACIQAVSIDGKYIDEVNIVPSKELVSINETRLLVY